MLAAKFPSTVTLHGNEIPEKHRQVIDLNVVFTKLSAPNVANTVLHYPVFEMPIQANVWHKACAKRAGIKDWFPWKVDRDVSCHGCGRKLRRTINVRNEESE